MKKLIFFLLFAMCAFGQVKISEMDSITTYQASLIIPVQRDSTGVYTWRKLMWMDLDTLTKSRVLALIQDDLDLIYTLQDTVNMFDPDHDGTVNFSGLESTLQDTIALILSLQDTINLFDTDHDGAVDNIQEESVSYDDFTIPVQARFDFLHTLQDTLNMIDTDHDGKVNSINDNVINYGMMDGEIKTVTESSIADTFWTYLGTAGSYTSPRVMSILNISGYWPLEYVSTTLSGGWWLVSRTADAGPSDATTINSIVFIIEQ